MSIFGTMKTAISGMNAQANRLGTVGDNIANSSTTGYKRSSTEFSTLVLPSSQGSYTSGGVQTNVRYSIADQGGITYTTSSTDLAVRGNGFFVVSDPAGTPYLTRAGAFEKDDEGYLINTAGYKLMGKPYADGEPTLSGNSLGDLVPVKIPINISEFDLAPTPTSAASVSVNLDQQAEVGTTEKTSITAYDYAGAAVIYDITYTKTASASATDPASPPDQWEVSITRQDTGKSVTDPVVLSFSPPDYALSGASSLTIKDDRSGVVQEIAVDISGTTQFARAFLPGAPTVNGNPQSLASNVEISTDGVVSVVYDGTGTRRPVFQIPLATVVSANNLEVIDGNVYLPTRDSGDVYVGGAQSGVFGAIYSGALENANVDIADELTEMIEAQRVYTANSKVFQTGSEIMEVLINLKR